MKNMTGKGDRRGGGAGIFGGVVEGALGVVKDALRGAKEALNFVKRVLGVVGRVFCGAGISRRSLAKLRAALSATRFEAELSSLAGLLSAFRSAAKFRLASSVARSFADFSFGAAMSSLAKFRPAAAMSFAGLLLWSVAALSLSSCVVSSEDGVRTETNNVAMDFSALTRSAADNTRIYLYDPDLANDGTDDQLRSKVLNINRIDEEHVSATMPAGMWDIWFVATEDGLGMERIYDPTVGYSPADEIMFRLEPQGGVLPSAPILLTGKIDNQQILPNQHQQAEVMFSRNVARVMFTLKDPEGFRTGAVHTVRLSDVPTAIKWNGELYPDRVNPAVSSVEMKGTLSIRNTADGGQESDVVNFIIPADRGQAPSKRMKVAVDMVVASGEVYTTEVPVEIPLTVKANGQLLVNLVAEVGGELTVDSAVILPWEEVNTDQDIWSSPNVEMVVEKTEIEMQTKATMIVTARNEGKVIVPEVIPGADWVSGSVVGNTLTINADCEEYSGEPRETWIGVKAANFMKRIRVVQNHLDTPSITSVVPDRVVLSPRTTQKEIVMTGTGNPQYVHLPTGFLEPDGNLRYSTIGGFSAGGQWPVKLTLRRKGPNIANPDFDNGDYSFYGDDVLYVQHHESLYTVKVPVSNIFMRAEDIGVAIPATGTTTHTVENIEIFGGTKQFTVSNWPEWVTAASCVANTNPATMAEKPWVLRLTVKAEGANDVWEAGTIRITSVDDPNYYIMVPISPGLSALIPEFDYFMIRHAWSGGYDADLAFGFRNASPDSNAPAFYDKPIGFGWNGVGTQTPLAVKKDGTYTESTTDTDILIQWAGDGVGSGNREEVYFNSPLIDNDNTLPRKLRMEVRVAWYSTSRPNTSMNITVEAYRGGVMRRNGSYGYDYVPDLNPQPGDGKLDLSTIEYTRACYLNKVVSSSNYTSVTPFALMCTITYDRITHMANVVWDPGTIRPRSAPPPLVYPHTAPINMAVDADRQTDPNEKE
ncbi:MAG: FimB/Mfa2 family fimbrial subunit [Alistipes sp.]|nr:FimB/Mfa2 family fimbrial subunit [Alistipes sp.]